MKKKEAPAKKSKNLIKKAVPAFSLIFLCMTALLTGLVFYLTTDHAKTLLLDKVNNTIPGTIVAGGWDVSLTKAWIELSELVVKDTAGETCFEFNRLWVSFRPASLFNRNIEIDDLLLTGLSINANINENGEANLAHVFFDPEKKVPKKEAAGRTGANLPVNLRINRARIINASMNVTTPTGTFTAPSITLTLSDADLFKQKLSLGAVIKKSTARLNGKPISFKALTLTSDFDQGQRALFDLDLNSDFLNLTAKGSFSGIPDQPEMDLLIRAESRIEALAEFFKTETKTEGRAGLVLSGKGTLNNPDLNLSLDVKGYQVSGRTGNGTLALSAVLSDRKIILKKARLNLFDTLAILEGRADLTSLFPNGFLRQTGDMETVTYGLSLNVENADVRNFEPWTKKFSGRLSSRGRVSGTGVTPQSLMADIDLTARFTDAGLKKSDKKIPEVTADIKGTIEKGRLILEHLKIQADKAETLVSGWFDIAGKTLDMAADIKSGDLSRFALPFGIDDVQGSFDAHLTALGNADHPRITALLSGTDLGIGRTVADQVKLNFTLDKTGKADLEEFFIRQDQGKIRAKGTLALFDPGFTLKNVLHSNLNLTGHGVNPGPYLTHLELGIPPDIISSDLDLDLDIALAYDSSTRFNTNGLLDKPIPLEELNADIDFKTGKVSLFLDPFLSLETGIDAALKQHTTIIDFTGQPLAPILETIGIKGIRAGITGRVISTGILPDDPLGTLTTELDRAGGNMSIRADLGGSFKRPDIKAFIDLDNIHYDLPGHDFRISGLTGSITAAPDRITLDKINGSINQGSLRINAVIDIDQHKPSGANLAFEINSVKLPIPGHGKEDLFINHADADLSVNLAYTPPLPGGNGPFLEKPIPVQNLDAMIDLGEKSIVLTLDGTTDCQGAFDPATSAFDLDLTFRDTDLTRFFETVGMKTMGGTIKGRLTSAGTAQVNLSEELLQSLESAKGMISLNAALDGSFEKPDVKTSLALSHIDLDIPQAQLGVRELNGTINASNRQVAIHDLAAKLGNGSLALDGSLGLEDYQPVTGSLNITGKELFISLPDTAECEFSTNLLFKGNPGKSTLSGSLTLIDGQFFQDLDITSTLTEKKRKTAVTQSTDKNKPPWFDMMNLDIKIDYKNPFMIDNNLAFILIEPDITVTGSVSNPIVTGRTSIIEGTVTYHGKEFEIEKGVIDFTDPYGVDPEITINGKTEIRDWSILLGISGKKDNLNFRLYSDPSETHEDILSLLIAGKTTKELGKKGSGSATGVLTDKAAEMLGQGVKDATPLDSFKMGYQDDGSGGSDISIALGKKLSRRLSINYSMDTVDEEAVHTNEAEYKILENFTVKAFNDSKGDFGTEFSFKLEF